MRRGVSMNLAGPSPGETRVRAALEHYDSFGRMVKIETPAKPGGGNVVTDYQYDVSNRLKHVNLGGQERTFTYDNRGFLAQECHPEKGVNGNGCVTYSSYDALGNAKQKDEGSRRLTSSYDFAGRLIKVQSNWDATVSEWFYDGGDGFGKGKVHLTRRTQRVNFPDDGVGGVDVVVQEKINYTGPAGAATSHSLTLQLPGALPDYGFLMGTVYNDAGQRTRKAYPSCWGMACAGDDPSRDVYSGWTRGFLTSVTGLASSITYHPQGLWSTVAHTNGVTDNQKRCHTPLVTARLRSAGGGGCSVSWRCPEAARASLAMGRWSQREEFSLADERSPAPRADRWPTGVRCGEVGGEW